MLRSGDLLSDRYRLDAHIAAGGMSHVWRASDVVLDRTVAVKVLLPALLTDPDFMARFRAEARMVAALRHPGIVAVYDYGESEVSGGTAAYMVMAYVEGEPLSRRIAKVGRLDVAETMSVVAQAGQALHAAHSNGIVHRDVKPGNLLVRPGGNVMLLDFGVARSSAATGITAANTVPGTALYMAPEQASGQAVSPATDIYALGAVAYHCLAGRAPFSGDNPLEVAFQHLHGEPPPLPDDVPAPVRALVGRALAKDPTDRYPTAAAMSAAATAIGRAGAAHPGAAHPGAAHPGAAHPGAADHDAAAAVPRAVVAAPAPSTMAEGAITPVHPGRSRKRPAVAAAIAAVLLGLAGLAAVLGLDRAGPTLPSGEVPASSAPATRTPPVAPVVTDSAQPGGPAPSQPTARSSGPTAPPATRTTGPSPTPSRTRPSGTPTPSPTPPPAATVEPSTLPTP